MNNKSTGFTLFSYLAK